MPITVAAALDLYRSNNVDLDSDDLSASKNSKDYLVEQITRISTNVEDFPTLYHGSYHLPYGSSARRTKVQPLDDIDMMQVLHACGGWMTYVAPYMYSIKIPSSQVPLWASTDDGSVNSTKVLNKFKK